jgi:hypothetical protein
MGLTGRQRHMPVSAWEQWIIWPPMWHGLNGTSRGPQHLVCQCPLNTKSCPSIVFFFCSFIERKPRLTWSGMGRRRAAHGMAWVGQTACKPGSVSGRTGRTTTIHLGRPLPDASRDQPGRRGRKRSLVRPEPPRVAPTRSCSRWGLPCRRRCRRRGALLPHPFTLTRRAEAGRAVCFLWHFPWGRPRRGLPGTAFPWSPDFPPAGACAPAGGRPAVWPGP